MNALLNLVKRRPTLYHFLRHRIYGRMCSANRKRIFLDVYRKNLWGDGFSVSGPGSTMETTENLRTTLPLLVNTLGAKSFLDIPCGDFQWMKHVPLGVDKYVGADIVLPLIEKNQKEFGDRGTFLHLDLLRDALPSADAVFCRDCFVHLSFREIRRALDNIARSSARYLITTTFPSHLQNADTVTPYWRALNLQLAPFNFPPPLHLLRDFSASQRNDQGKHLGAWRIQDILSSAAS